MTVIASNGYEYEDITQRLIGKPKDCRRNDQVRRFRRSGYGEKAVQAYIASFDAARSHLDEYAADRRALAAARDTGDFFACESRRN